ncbi:hypothetical protein ABPG74_003983 [Tetrahymena malaccensis]
MGGGNAQNEDSNNSGEQDSASIARKQHRRNKDQIEREYICGWPDCGKQYGTNAALYTHTKNKHKSIEHPNTKRPNSESVVGRKGRPLQSLQENKGFPINSNEPPKDLDKKLEVISIWSDSRFIDMIHLIGMYGDSENTNQFTREMEDESSAITEDTIKEYIDKIKNQFDSKIPFTCPPHVKNFLIKASHFWKAKVQEELNIVLLYSVMFSGQAIKTLQTYISNKDRTEYKTFQKLIDTKKGDEFSNFVLKIYKILMEQQNTTENGDANS